MSAHSAVFPSRRRATAAFEDWTCPPRLDTTSPRTRELRAPALPPHSIVPLDWRRPRRRAKCCCSHRHPSTAGSYRPLKAWRVARATAGRYTTTPRARAATQRAETASRDLATLHAMSTVRPRAYPSSRDSALPTQQASCALSALWAACAMTQRGGSTRRNSHKCARHRLPARGAESTHR